MFNEKKIQLPMIKKGDETQAFRDPCAVYDKGKFHIFFTYVDNGVGGPWLHLAKITTIDFVEYSEMKILTPRDKSKNYSSPGSIVKMNNQWILCLQTYCRENGEKYGNHNSRLYTMASYDLENFEEPKLLKVKGEVLEGEMGRMIDPYLIKKENEWWCFFKQNGVSYSRSKDLNHWEFMGNIDGGENVCVVKYEDKYLLYHSPHNGIGVKHSSDLVHWEDFGDTITLGQSQWDWAKGRITAGFVLDVSTVAQKKLYIMLYHASGPEDEQTMFDRNASLGIAYSYDLKGEWIYN